MKHCFALFTAMLALSVAVAQNNFRQQDRWLALIDYTQISTESIKRVAPHFPKSEVSNEKSYNEFSEKLNHWKKKHQNEVEAFLALPEVIKVNPSRVHLGLQQAIDKRKFENSYWQWINAAGLKELELKSFAPNFPLPKITTDLPKSEAIYDAALQDWMKLFPKEHEALLNHPQLITLKKSHEPFVLDISTAEPFTLMEIKEKMPNRTEYDSGNASLDNLRYEMALKHWYFRYRTDEYITRYNVKDFHQNKEEK